MNIQLILGILTIFLAFSKHFVETKQLRIIKKPVYEVYLLKRDEATTLDYITNFQIGSIDHQTNYPLDKINYLEVQKNISVNRTNESKITIRFNENILKFKTIKVNFIFWNKQKSASIKSQSIEIIDISTKNIKLQSISLSENSKKSIGDPIELEEFFPQIYFQYYYWKNKISCYIKFDRTFKINFMLRNKLTKTEKKTEIIFLSIKIKKLNESITCYVNNRRFLEISGLKKPSFTLKSIANQMIMFNLRDKTKISKKMNQGLIAEMAVAYYDKPFKFRCMWYHSGKEVVLKNVNELDGYYNCDYKRFIYSNRSETGLYKLKVIAGNKTIQLNYNVKMNQKKRQGCWYGYLFFGLLCKTWFRIMMIISLPINILIIAGFIYMRKRRRNINKKKAPKKLKVEAQSN